MGIITWLHLSDLHFQAGEQHTWDENIVLRALLKDIAERSERDGLRPDFIVVTGDIAFSGEPAEYELARKFFDELLSITKLGKDRLFLIPGNHDVDRERISRGAQSIAASLLDRKSVNDVLGNATDRSLMLARFQGYASFINDYLGEHLSFDDEHYFYVHTLDLAGQRIALLGLNSAWLACGGDEDRSQLLLGERQVRAAVDAAKDANLRLAVMHHPFHWLRDFDCADAEALLCRGCDFVLHGHMHEVALLQTRGPDGEAMIIAAGACYETRKHLNSYNFVRLDLSTGQGTVYLRMYSDRQGGFWTKDVINYQNVSDGRYEFPWTVAREATPAAPSPLPDAALPGQPPPPTQQAGAGEQLPPAEKVPPSGQRVRGWLIQALRDPAWQGLAALIAVLAIAIALATWFWPDIRLLLSPAPTATVAVTPSPTPTPISFQDFEKDNGTPSDQIEDGCWRASSATCSFSEPPSPVHNGDRALRVDTRMKEQGATDDHGGTVSIKPSSAGPVDLSSANVISVWVYDTQDNNTVEMKMQDADGKTSNGVSSPMAAVQDNWTQITWNLDEFTAVDRSRISSIELYERNDGVYYLDDIIYSWLPQVEFFEGLDLRLFSASMRDEIAAHEPRLRLYYAPPAVLRLSTLSPGSDADEGYQITYGWVSAEQYACWGINLKEPLDISSWSRLSFDIKGLTGTEIAHVWLGSPSPSGDVRNIAVTDWEAEPGTPERVQIPITDAWHPVEIALADFREQNGEQQTIDPKRIQEISICFEWGETEGTVFVDNVAFE